MSLSFVKLFCPKESPFHPKIVNPQKVRVIGGWDNIIDKDNQFSIFVGEEKRISFDLSECGPGLSLF